MSSDVVFKTLKVFDFYYAYLDSGVPKASEYTTWVFVHGMGFNGAVFKKLLPVASDHNLRIVSLYRRGFPPSSPFHESELACLGRGKKIEDAEPWFRSQAVELATFLVTFAMEQRITSADQNRPAGGIVLIGWSLGGVHVHALLAYLDALTEETRSNLERYLHTVLLHDISAHFLGIPSAVTPSSHAVNLWSKTDIKARLDAFCEWTTGHFEHRSVTSGELEDLKFDDPSEQPHSMHELSPEQHAEFTCLDAFAPTGCDGLLVACDDSTFRVLTKRALFDNTLAQKLPKLRVRYMSGGASVGALVWAVWMLRKYAANPKEFYGDDAEKARDIKCISQMEGNHFIFWDDPNKAIEHYNTAITL